MADQFEHHWETMAAYKGSDVADDEEVQGASKKLRELQSTVQLTCKFTV